jgi:hypothetical protein
MQAEAYKTHHSTPVQKSLKNRKIKKIKKSAHLKKLLQ